MSAALAIVVACGDVATTPALDDEAIAASTSSGGDDDPTAAGDVASPPDPQPTVPSAEVGTIAGAATVTDNGTASYVMTLEVPPGIGGMQPSLSLTYSSAGGYGIAGVGWSLGGFSSITRCEPNLRDDGRKGPIQYDDTDPLCLDGNRLVAVQGEHGADGTEYRTRVDQYARIVGHHDMGSAGSYFEVFLKDGRTAHYGTGTSSRIERDAVASGWALSLVADRNQNYIEYSYTSEELIYYSGATGYTADVDHRPTRIDYTRHGMQAPQRSVLFDYDNVPARRTSWSNGTVDRRAHRLTRITTWAPGPSMVRRYSLDYVQDSVSGRDLLAQVQECDAHAKCKPATQFEWALGGEGYEDVPQFEGWDDWGWMPEALNEQAFRRLVLDINGDNAHDFLWIYTPLAQYDWRFWVSPGRDQLMPSNVPNSGIATGIGTGPIWPEIIQSYPGNGGASQAIDFNGDERDDVAFVAQMMVDQLTPGLIDDGEHYGEVVTVLVARPQVSGLDAIGFEEVTIDDGSTEPIRQGFFPDLDGDGFNDALLCRGDELETSTWVYARGIVVNPQGTFTSRNTFDFTDGGVDTGILCSRFDEYLFLDADGDGGSDLLVIPFRDANGVIPDYERNDYSRLAIDFAAQTAELVPAGLPRDRAQRWRHPNNYWPTDFPGRTAGPGIDKLLDLNADGLVDILRYELATGDDVANMPAIVDFFDDEGNVVYGPEAGGLRPWFNTGTGFARGSTFALELTERGQLGTVVYSATPIDYNGDGRGDLLIPELDAAANNWNDINVLVTREQSFDVVPTDLTIYMPLPAEQPFRIQPSLDFDADGSQDIALYAAGGWDVQRGLTTYADVLESVTDGLGKVTTFEWGKTMDPDVHDACLLTFSGQRCDRSIRPVVAALREDAGLESGQTYDLEYHYFGGETDRRGRGSLGFDRVRIVETNGTLVRSVTERWFDQAYDQEVDDFPYVGRVRHELTHHNVATGGQADRWEVAEVDYEFDARPHPVHAGVHDVVAWRTLSRRWQIDDPCGTMVNDITVCEPYELEANLWYFVSETTLDEIDEFGNVGLTSRVVDDAWLDEVETSYANDTTSWILGRPTSIVARSTDDTDFMQTRELTAGYDPATGLLAWTIREPNDPELYRRTDIERDVYGNVRDVTETAQGLTRTKTTIWNGEGTFPSDVFNALDHHAVVTYDLGLGLPTAHVDPNGVTTVWTSDGFGRLVASERRSSPMGPSDGGNTSVTYAAVVDPVAAMTVTTSVVGGNTASETLDRRGRPIRRDWLGFGAVPSYSTIEYDEWLQPSRESLPTKVGDPIAGYTTVFRDDLGRVFSTWAPNATHVDLAYEATLASQHIERTDEEGKTASVDIDDLGHVVRSTDALGTVTCYQWGPFGNLREIQRDCEGAEPPAPVSIEFDAWGRKRSLTDEALGPRSYDYDGFDRLAETTDANEEETSFVYDALDRIMSRIDSDGGATWTWDTVKLGLLTKSTSSDAVTRSYTYDGYSRATKTTTSYGTNSFAIELVFDGFNRVGQIKYPASGAKVNIDQIYDAAGNLDKVQRSGGGTVYWDAQTVDAAGRVRAELFGNGAKTTRTYDELSGRITALQTIAFGSTVQQLAYGWSDAGDLEFREDALRDQSDTLEYDDLHRLSSWSAEKSGATIADWAEYDVLGNFTFRSDVGDYDYVAGRVTSAGVHTYLYDDAGNAITRDAQALTWTPQGKLRHLVNGAETLDFKYDADGNRVVRSTNLPATTISVDGLYERETTSLTRHKYYIWAAGRVVAEIERKQSGTTWTETPRYVHDDHLGSTDVISPHVSTSPIERMSFDVWGRPRDPLNWTLSSGVAFALGVNVGFTGHMAQRDGGLVNMRGRMYDPDIGRFVSPDPFVASTFDLRALNRYSYVLNNPVRWIDPSGFFPGDCPPPNPEPPPVEEPVKGGTKVDISDEPIVIEPSPPCPDDPDDEDDEAEEEKNGSSENGGGDSGEGSRSAAGDLLNAAVGTYASVIQTTVIDPGRAVLGGAYDNARGIGSVLAGGPDAVIEAVILGAGTDFGTVLGAYEEVPTQLGDGDLLGAAETWFRGSVAAASLATTFTGGGVGGRGAQLGNHADDVARGSPPTPPGGSSGAGGAGRGGPLRRVGDLLESVDDVFANPNLLEGKHPVLVESAIGQTPGWRVETLRRGSHAGQGWVFREYGPKGETGRMIAWHPGGGHHGPSPYWKVSSSAGGTTRIGPQFE